MQSHCLLLLLVLCAGLGHSAPSEQLSVDKNPPADSSSPPAAPATSSSLATAPATSSSLATAPAAAYSSLDTALNPDSADPDVAVKAAEQSLLKVRDQLRDDVASIVATANAAGQMKAADEAAASITVPEISIKPVEITANKKYAEIIGQFIADLIQIPIVLHHVFWEAAPWLTWSKQPLLVYPPTAGLAGGAVQTPPPHRAV